MPKCPRITCPAGSDTAVVDITADPRNQEPAHVRIQFPGGSLELVRATDGPDAEYWCHIRLVHPSDDGVTIGIEQAARVVAARVDIKGRHSHEVNVGELGSPDVYHLALRVQRVPAGEVR